MDTELLERLEQEVAKEKAKKKKKPSLQMMMEKRLSYYSGWNKSDKPVTKENKTERQTKLE